MLGTFTGEIIAVTQKEAYCDLLLLQEDGSNGPTVVEAAIKLDGYKDALPTRGEQVALYGRVYNQTFAGNSRIRLAVRTVADAVTGARLAAVS